MTPLPPPPPPRLVLLRVNSCVCGTKIYLNMNSQKNEKVAFSSKVTCDIQVSGNNTLIIADYKAIKISIFHKLVAKLWLREKVMINRNNPLRFYS